MRSNEEPRLRIEPERAGTDGEDAAELMETYGSRLDEWQRLIVDCWLGYDEAGRYNVASAGLSVPRQNGKNVCLEAREFFGLVINGEKILHTAHQVKTSKRSFKRIEALFTNTRFPEITGLVKNIRYTNGEEAIELTNGGCIEFSARSRQAARGFDGIGLVVFDEAQELTDEQLEAITPTLAASASGTRQILFTGTPPYPRCPGTVFRRHRTTCLENPDPDDCWHEWSVEAESVDEIDAENPDVWFDTNPALDRRLTREYTKKELRKMSKDGFARERLGWWSPVLTAVEEHPIDVAKWNDCASEELKPSGKTAYGVKFTPDGAEVVLCGAVCPADGPARISIIERRPTSQGVRWLSDWLNPRAKQACCVVIDGKNGVDVLVERIAESWRFKNSIVRAKPADVIAAASLLQTEVNEKTLTWYSEQITLRDSAIGAVKRAIGGGWGFGGDDPAPIEAAALALWGCRNSKRDPSRKMKVGC